MAQQLSRQFDTLFATTTGYDVLDQRIAKTRAKKQALLLVLDHPFLPLHNNGSEKFEMPSLAELILLKAQQVPSTT